MTNRMKSPQESYVEMRQMVMPNQTNAHNTIFGGVIMSWIDIAAAMVAERHSNKPVVTVHIDDIDFLAPIKIGDHVLIRAHLNYVGKSSMLIGVKVTVENPRTGDCRDTTKAYLTFIALDDVGRPTSVPGLEISTDEEKRRFNEGKIRLEENRQKAINKKKSKEN